MGGLPLCELNQLELEFLFLCNFDLHVKLEDMQAYGDQLLTHALTQQLCTLPLLLEEENHYKITSSLSVSSPPISPPISATSPTPSPSTSLSAAINTTSKLKRKRSNEDNTSPRTANKIQKSETLLDQALVPASNTTKSASSTINSSSSTKIILCNKLYSSYSSRHHHLDTILSSYTHDC